MRDDYGEFQRRETEMVALAKDSLENASGYFQRKDMPFPCLADPEGRVYRQYGVESRALSLGQRPGLFIVDREGVVRYAYLGTQQWQIPPNSEVLRQLGLLSGSA